MHACRSTLEDPTSGARLRLFPLGELGLTLDLLHHRYTRLVQRTTVGLEAYADPIRATYEPRLFGTLGLALSLPNNITVGLDGSFYSIATTEELPPPDPLLGATIPFDETLITVQLPATWHATYWLDLEVGGRIIARGPRLVQPGFAFGPLEMVAYAAVTVRFTTADEPQRVDAAPAARPAASPTRSVRDNVRTTPATPNTRAVDPGPARPSS